MMSTKLSKKSGDVNIIQYFKDNPSAPFIITFIVLLIGTGVNFMMGRKELANSLAVYAFYAVAVGITVQVVRLAISRRDVSVDPATSGSPECAALARTEAVTKEYAFEDLVRDEAAQKVCVISFGPVEKRDSGYFIRVWKTIEALSKKVDSISVLEFPEDDTPLGTRTLGNITFIRLSGNQTMYKNAESTAIKKRLTFDPKQVIDFQFHSAMELLRHRRIISCSDLVIVEGSLIPAANLIAKMLGKKVILDTHCVNKLLALGFKDRNRLAYIARIVFWDIVERLVMRLSDIVIAVSAKERQYIQSEYHIRSSKTILIPHTSDLPRMDYLDNDLRVLRDRLKLGDKKIITFVGDLRAVQNYDAAYFIISELAPAILKERNDVVFLIIGKGEESFSGKESTGVVFTGFVEDLGRYLAISDICIAPMRVGGGVKTKVLDYINYHKTILTTPIGAEGLEDNLQEGQITKIDDFSHRLLEMLRDHLGK